MFPPKDRHQLWKIAVPKRIELPLTLPAQIGYIWKSVNNCYIYDQFGCSGFIRFVFGIHESRDVEAVDHLLVLLAAFELTVSTFLLKDISDKLLHY